MIEHINWYPGHMKKTRDMIEENLKLVDVVIEVIDARIPRSSRNPIIDDLVSGKPRIIVLNKSDLADGAETERWISLFGGKTHAIEMNCMSGGGKKQLFARLEQLQARKNAGQLRHRPLRMMIVGVPNAGKSSLINRLTGKKSAKTGDRPGVTRGKQWLALENGMQLLDTPGILWPKFEDPKVGLNLAFCGSIKDEILDTSTLAFELLELLAARYPELLLKRYNLKELPDAEGLFDEDGREISPTLALMDAISLKRGFLLAGKKIDYERAGRAILDEFRGGLIGKITLEKAEGQVR